MKPFTSLIALDDARRRLAEAAAPVERMEELPLLQAAGRIVAAEVVSPMDVPPFARSSMDGFAVVAADTRGATPASPRRLRIVERIYTGRPPQHAVRTGACAEIATGAPLPDGADAVVIVEHTSAVADDLVDVREAVTAGQNIGAQASDLRAGETVVGAGELLTPGRLGAIGASGCPTVRVFAKPRVAVLSTGSEIVPPGQPLPRGSVFDVNRFTLAALIEAHGCVAEPREPVGDSVEALARALDGCAAADVIVFSGGSSVGDRDFTVEAIASRGEMIFHGVAIRPGKPTAFARVHGRPFFGLPGNPTSCLSQAYVLLVPFLRAVARLPPYEPRIVRVPLGRRIDTKPGRHQFYTVRLEGGAALPAFKGSGDITSLSRADGYIEIPADASVVEKDALVDVVLF